MHFGGGGLLYLGISKIAIFIQNKLLWTYCEKTYGKPIFSSGSWL